jgi:hypothetical protein
MQNYYNLLYREEEREMIPYCKDTGVGLVPVRLIQEIPSHSLFLTSMSSGPQMQGEYSHVLGTMLIRTRLCEADTTRH